MKRRKKVDLRKVKFTTSISVPSVVGDYFDKLALSAAMTIDSLTYGQLAGWRKKRVTKYLRIPIPYIERHYDEDGEYEGLLLNVWWWKTPIPIGKEVIEVPVYKKLKGTIKFRRYSPLKPAKSTKKKKTASPNRL